MVLVLCHATAEAWYSLGVVSWKTNKPGGCHGEALPGDVDGAGAGRSAETGKCRQIGCGEVGSSKDPAVGRSGGRRPSQVGCRDRRGAGVRPIQHRTGAQTVCRRKSGSGTDPEAEPAGVRAEDGRQGGSSTDRPGVQRPARGPGAMDASSVERSAGDAGGGGEGFL